MILVVEDDPILRDLARRQIKMLGFESILVETGEAALETDFSNVGLIFMDIGLPGIDGTQTTMLIRERELQEQQRHIPIVALTGHANRQQVLSAGMDDYLQKPALIADMKNMIAKWMAADAPCC